MRYVIILIILTFISCINFNKSSNNNFYYDDFYKVLHDLIRLRFSNVSLIVDETMPVYTNMYGNGSIPYSDKSVPPPPPPPGIICYDYNSFKYWVHTGQIDSIDAEFMYKSIDSTKTFKLDSSRLKVKLISQDEILNLIKHNKNDLNGTYDEIEKIYGSRCFIKVSTPIYNSDFTRLIISIDYMCGPLNGQGYKFIFKKYKNEWWLINDYGTWES